MKKQVLLILGALAIMVLAAACPYTSAIALSDPTVKVDKAFYGTWVLQSEDEFPPYYDIKEDDGKTFAMDKYSYNGDTQSYYIEASYKAWFTDISGTRFVNVFDVSDPSSFYIYRLDMQGKETFVLFEVTDNIDEQFTDPKEMVNFFKKYKDLSFFYNLGEETYVQAKG
jgi:hypothetical protein